MRLALLLGGGGMSALALSRLPPLSPTAFRVAILGDAHGEFRGDELATLAAAVAPSLFLAVGDLGNEDAAIVEELAAATRAHLACPAHVVLGNHEVWRSGRRGVGGAALKRIKAAVGGGLDVAYRRVEVPTADGVVSLVGARPLSWGGGLAATTDGAWALLRDLYDVDGADESRAVVADALLGAVGPAIVLAHQGPTGLGDDRAAICGRDWTRQSADFGDDDLRAALETVTNAGVPVPLCVFGHMHSGLRGGGRRRMVVADAAGTLFVNAAEVPRHRGSDFHFTVVDLEAGAAVRVTGVWLRAGAGVVETDALWEAPSS